MPRVVPEVLLDGHLETGAVTMSAFKQFAMVALAGVLAAPLSAQVSRTEPTVRDRIESARRRAEAQRAEEARRTESGTIARNTDRGSSKIPPGHRPPEGMCRVWIEGVPPGQQPAVTDCVTAERNRTANSRVIYGNDESFPGKGKGKGKLKRGADRDDDLLIYGDRDGSAKSAKAKKPNKGKGRS
jgi:hypothetical protein